MSNNTESAAFVTIFLVWLVFWLNMAGVMF